jgi:hypothetical protein
MNSPNPRTLSGLERRDSKLRILVGAIGFEPTTPCAQGRCATRLRYAPTILIINEMQGGSASSNPPPPSHRIL